MAARKKTSRKTSKRAPTKRTQASKSEPRQAASYTAHVAEMHEGQRGWKMPTEALSGDGAPAELRPGMLVTRSSDKTKWMVLEDIGPVRGDRWGRRRFTIGRISIAKSRRRAAK